MGGAAAGMFAIFLPGCSGAGLGLELSLVWAWRSSGAGEVPPTLGIKTHERPHVSRTLGLKIKDLGLEKPGLWA